MLAHFAEFTLDTGSRQLCRGDIERHLSPKAFDLLCLLIQARPRALSKRELHERLWPATFVSDSTLTSLVAEVREALGEKARTARFVRTVFRFGYAFTGDVGDAAPAARGPADLVRCWLVWDSGQVALADGVHLLGRDADVAVWLESPTVSRHHARLCLAGAEATIEDLGSKNGTYLRGERLHTRSRVNDGDDLRFGSFPVKFRAVRTSGSTETVECTPTPGISRTRS